MADNKETTYDIIKHLNQAAANAWDGSHEESFNPDKAKKIGLKREKAPYNSYRLFDAFNVKINDNILSIVYNSQITTKEYHNSPKLKQECEKIIADIVKYLKREYKELAGKSIKLKKIGDIDVFTQHISSIRNTLVAVQKFEISGIESLEDED